MTQPSLSTHEVLNQSPPFEDVDLFVLDRPLVDAVAASHLVALRAGHAIEGQSLRVVAPGVALVQLPGEDRIRKSLPGGRAATDHSGRLERPIADGVVWFLGGAHLRVRQRGSSGGLELGRQRRGTRSPGDPHHRSSSRGERQLLADRAR